jgi:hypothetical protein
MSRVLPRRDAAVHHLAVVQVRPPRTAATEVKLDVLESAYRAPRPHHAIHEDSLTVARIA